VQVFLDGFGMFLRSSDVSLFFDHVLVATAKSFTQALVGSDPHRKRPAGRRPPSALLPAARRPGEAAHGRGVSDGLRAGLQFQGDLGG